MRVVKRELLILLVLLLAAIIVVFPLTYLMGRETLGPYGETGSLWRFIGDLFAELGNGNPAIWFFLCTPWLAISFVRLGVSAFRRL